MQIEITIQNYRCFSESRPARFTLGDGTVAFVGPNNAGKSTLLKFFYEFRSLFNLISQAQQYVDREDTVQLSGVIDYPQLFCKANANDIVVDVSLPEIAARPQSQLEVDRAIVTLRRAQNNYRVDLLSRDVPVLRTGHPGPWGGRPQADTSELKQVLLLLSKAAYFPAFRVATHVVSPGGKYFDLHLGQDLINRWLEWKYGTSAERRETALQFESDLANIFSFPDLDIGAGPNKDYVSVAAGGRSYTLDELGAGLAQVFIILANAAMSSPELVLIDEPELNLHPTLQVELIAALERYAQQGVLFATHSVGLAQCAAERAYAVWQDASGATEVTPLAQTRDATIRLRELLYPDDVRCVVLVEGKHDIPLIKSLLRLYAGRPRCAVLPLAGGQLIRPDAREALAEYKEVAGAVARVVAIVDSERASAGAELSRDRRGFRDVCRELGIACLVTERRAIENYFKESAIRAAFPQQPQYRQLEHYESLRDANPSWSKGHNSRIAARMTREDLDGTDLGEFLARLCQE